MDTAKDFFNKKFTFNKSPSWILPEYTENTILNSSQFECSELLRFKEYLNSVKSRLNDFPIEEWSLHTKKRNPAGEIQWKLRNKYNAEFVTQAWCKMFECLCAYDLVSLMPNQTTFNSLHLCEAPGAFVAALNHFLRTKHKSIKFNWIATTLNPYYEGNQVSSMILDDRFMLQTLDHWYFGHDFTGNIMDSKNIHSLRAKCESIEPVTLITADGSIDCFHTPEEQENKVAQLHIYEVISALLILHSGGNFLLKMFTFFECSSINILYLLNIAFSSVNVFKPATSKGGNSEVYVVCLNYNRSDEILDFINTLLNKLELNDLNTKSIFRLCDIRDDFIKQVIDCAEYFMNFQCYVIEDNIMNFYIPKPYHVTQKLKSLVTQYFLKEYKVEVIEENLKIVCGNIYYKQLNLNPRLHTGTYNERTKPLNGVDRMIFLQARCFNFQQYHWNDLENYKLINNNIGTEDLELALIFGKPINILCSSKFVFAPILDMHKQALNICKRCVLKRSDSIAWLHVHSILKNQRFIWIMNDIDLVDNVLSYDRYEKNLFRKFLDLKLDVGQNIAIYNFPTLTLFSVGILYLLANYYFKEVAFVKYNCILFINYKNSRKPYLQEILNIVDCKKKDESILSVIPISNICSGEFYNDVLMFNNANLMYESHLLLFN